MIIISNEKFRDKLFHAYDVFRGKDDERAPMQYMHGSGSSRRPDRSRLSRGNDRSIVTSIYNRLAVDAAENEIHHVKLNDEDQYISDIDSGLNYALSESANLDQTGTALIQDAIMTLFDEGVIAIVPTDTVGLDPTTSESYDVKKLRVGTIVEWFPEDIRVSLYNEKAGKKQLITISKTQAAIVENPFYAIMNEPNSILQRLIKKLNILDVIDEQSGSGKLDLILQLPYNLKSEAKVEATEKRIDNLISQLKDSQYGIGYIDATERITQLNRPVENNLMQQIIYLTDMVFNELGVTKSIFDGTASAEAMLNYYNRSIAPVLNALTQEMRRKFISKTARSQKQSIMWFNDPFKLIPISDLAEIADKFTRNKIMTSNEMRAKIGLKPSKDPSADKLENSNLNQPEDVNAKETTDDKATAEEGEKDEE